MIKIIKGSIKKNTDAFLVKYEMVVSSASFRDVLAIKENRSRQKYK